MHDQWVATKQFPVPLVEAQVLRELHQRSNRRGQTRSDRQEAARVLDLACASLVKNGYTEQSVADVLGTTRAAVNRRTLRARREQSDGLAAVPVLIDRRKPTPEPAPPTPRLTDHEVERALELQPLAKRRNRHLRNDPGIAAAAEEYNTILLAGRSRGATAYNMAQDLGVTTAAIQQRLDRLLGSRTGLNDVPVGVVGHLGSFAPETTPRAAEGPADPFEVDPLARDLATAEHHSLVRMLRESAVKAGLPTEVWDVGQDVSFVADGVLYNVEVKTLPAQPDTQLRLGTGQLHQQVEQHLANAAAGVTWYETAGVGAVVAVLAVTNIGRVNATWQRLAARLGHAIVSGPALAALLTAGDFTWQSTPLGLAYPPLQMR